MCTLWIIAPFSRNFVSVCPDYAHYGVTLWMDMRRRRRFKHFLSLTINRCSRKMDGNKAIIYFLKGNEQESMLFHATADLI